MAGPAKRDDAVAFGNADRLRESDAAALSCGGHGALTLRTARPNTLDRLVFHSDETNRGYSTATTTNVAYRLGIIARHGVLEGRWLDCGSAEGGFAAALPSFGASSVVAVDIEHPRVAEGATRPDGASVSFSCAASE